MNIVKEEGLVANVADKGALLSRLLQERLSGHPNVGNIRGRGLFWGIEFVADKATKKAFPTTATMAMRLSDLGLLNPYNIAVYPGSGTVDGFQGDHIIVSPPYNITAEDVEGIVDTLVKLISDFFAAESA